MELFWYIVLMVMLVTYIILDGYDFGAGIIHLFFGKNDKDKKAITNAIGLFGMLTKYGLLLLEVFYFLLFQHYMQFHLADFICLLFLFCGYLSSEQLA